jgi:universal stress protein A
MPYQNILVAVDLGATTRRHSAGCVTSQPKQRAAACATRDRTAGHHLRRRYSHGFSAIQEEIQAQAGAAGPAVFGLVDPRGNRHLVTGRPESEIPTQAKAVACDLIVVGTHARWGLALAAGLHH